jgi:hypothetical protein
VLLAKIPQLEEIAEQLSRARRYHHRIRFGDALKARGKVGRFAHHAPLLCFSRPNRVTHDDHARGDADPYLQGRVSRRDQLRDSLDEGKARLDGALGIMLVGLRIAEIDQHPVTHVLGDETAETLDCLGAAAMVGADDRAQILRIEGCR